MQRNLPIEANARIVPLILTQHWSRDLNRYLDREGVIYHFPERYLPIVKQVVVEGGDRRFLYQRPLKGAPQGQAGTYFGRGLLGEPYADVTNPGHYFVDIFDYEAIVPVGLKSPASTYYETGTHSIMLQGRSIRYADPMVYFAILAAAQVYSPLLAMGDAHDTGVFAPTRPPVDTFRELLVVPPGTGYVPHGDGVPDRFEAAALHERARDDHQTMLARLMETVRERGGVCLYNNNVDLYAKIGERRLLVEVKSLRQQSAAVNRMRYGMGQIMDYRVRYEAELAGAEPVLAFATPPERDVSWIPTILQGNGIAFVTQTSGRIAPGNDLGNALPLF